MKEYIDKLQQALSNLDNLEIRPGVNNAIYLGGAAALIKEVGEALYASIEEEE